MTGVWVGSDTAMPPFDIPGFPGFMDYSRRLAEESTGNVSGSFCEDEPLRLNGRIEFLPACGFGFTRLHSWQEVSLQLKHSAGWGHSSALRSAKKTMPTINATPPRI